MEHGRVAKDVQGDALRAEIHDDAIWKSYLQVIAACAGQALHVLDRFHITSHLNQAVDEVRRAESARFGLKARKPPSGSSICAGLYSAAAARLARGVERVNAVVFGSHEDHVVHAFPRYFELWHIERLRENSAIHRKQEDSRELRRVHVSRREDGFVQVGAAAAVVNLRGRNRRLCPYASRKNEQESQCAGHWRT